MIFKRTGTSFGLLKPRDHGQRSSGKSLKCGQVKKPAKIIDSESRFTLTKRNNRLVLDQKTDPMVRTQEIKSRANKKCSDQVDILGDLIRDDRRESNRIKRQPGIKNSSKNR
jgi:hypothetical protein